jgi:hypothetical protein
VRCSGFLAANHLGFFNRLLRKLPGFGKKVRNWDGRKFSFFLWLVVCLWMEIEIYGTVVSGWFLYSARVIFDESSFFLDGFMVFSP